MPDLTLTPAAADDFAFTHDLTRSNMNEYVTRHWGGWDAAIYRANYDAGENLILRRAGERVGYVRLKPAGDALTLEDLQIRPDCQNQGLGAWALAEVTELARTRGYRAVRLRCFHENPAHRLYRRCGFVVVETAAGADWMQLPTG
jgi:GNAT superfamily N-acetyltransferase